MANDSAEYEGILKKTEAPDRVKKGNGIKERLAKLNPRTNSGVRKKERLAKRYERYNRTYAQFSSAVKELENLQAMHKAGSDITATDLKIAAAKANNYSSKLARLGVKLLDEDIKKTTQKETVKKIKVPHKIFSKLAWVVELWAKGQAKVKGIGVKKQLKKEAKENIKTAIEGSLFSENGEVKENIVVPAALSLKGTIDQAAMEREIGNLREFVPGIAPLEETQTGSKKTSASDSTTTPTRSIFGNSTANEEENKKEEKNESQENVEIKQDGNANETEVAGKASLFDKLIGKENVSSTTKPSSTEETKSDDSKKVENGSDNLPKDTTDVVDTGETKANDDAEKGSTLTSNPEEKKTNSSQEDAEEIISKYTEFREVEVKYEKGEIDKETYLRAKGKFEGYMHTKRLDVKGNSQSLEEKNNNSSKSEITMTVTPDRVSETGKPKTTTLSLADAKKLIATERERGEKLKTQGEKLVDDYKKAQAKHAELKETRKLIEEWKALTNTNEQYEAQNVQTAAQIAQLERENEAISAEIATAYLKK